ncbi:MAG TPA: MOSC domain-containing protein [Amnibacterium sp.]|nr:MOSC domain-containing protein [Amnibacterium sp.]
MTDGVLVAACRVHQLIPDSGNGTTAIDKRPATGAVRVSRFGLFGDVQADRRHHGGEDQAVYAYAEEDALHFSRELERAVPPGLFGENLRTRGIAVTDAVIGERWRVGTQVLLEVTYPRTPCGTFERRMGLPDWQDRFRRHGASGAYLRVLKAGSIRAGDTVAVVERPAHGVTIGRWFQRQDPDDARALLAAHADGAVVLREKLRDHIDRAVRRAGV